MLLRHRDVQGQVYVKHEGRWWHKADTRHQGPQMSQQDFERGAVLAPLIECYRPLDTTRLVVARQAGLLPAPAPLPHPTRDLLACKPCGKVTGCTCGKSTPGGLDAIVALQKARGRQM
jgi:hypothetical protein